MDRKRKAKIGLLLIGSPRFRDLGEGTSGGTYAERKDREAERIAAAFGAAGEIVYGGMIYERADVGKAIRLFCAEEVDCVTAIYLSWAEDFAWIRFLRDMPPVPVFFGSIIRDSLAIGDTGDEDRFVEFLSAGSLVGAQEASGSVARFARPMTETCLATLEEMTRKLAAFAGAARARNLLKASTMGLLACYNEVMWSTYVDPYDVFMKAGPELRFLSVAQLARKTEEVPEERALKTAGALASQFRVLENVDREKLTASVKASLAVEDLARDYDIDLLVMNDVDPVLFREIGLRPGFVPTSRDSELCVVPEGDIGGGLAVYILQLLSGKAANFIEPFYIDKPNGTFAAGHAGPNNYWERPANTVIARDERFAKTRYKYAGAPFAWYVFPEGQKTMLHMSENNGRIKMVCTLVEALPTEHALASYSHADFRHASLSPQELFEKILKIGVTQHYGIVGGDHLGELEALAKIMDFDFYQI